MIIVILLLFNFFFTKDVRKTYKADELTWGPVSLVVWPAGRGAAGQSSEVRRWNVTFNGHLMTKEMCVVDPCLCYAPQDKRPKMTEFLDFAKVNKTRNCSRWCWWIITWHFFHNHHRRHISTESVCCSITTWTPSSLWTVEVSWVFAAVIFQESTTSGHSLFYYQERHFITWLAVCY